MNIHKTICILSLVFPFTTFAAEKNVPQPPEPSPANIQAPQTHKTEAGSTDISGTYLCKGYDPYNKRNYFFPEMVVVKKGDLYNIQWQDDAGNPIMIGNAVTNASVHDGYAVVYWPAKPDYYLVGQYVRNSDGSLQSNWIVAGNKLVGTELCTKK